MDPPDPMISTTELSRDLDHKLFGGIVLGSLVFHGLPWKMLTTHGNVRDIQLDYTAMRRLTVFRSAQHWPMHAYAMYGTLMNIPRC